MTIGVQDALDDGAPPIMAILRGVEPEEAVAIGGALVDAGIRLIEVPFNSPRPTESIAALVAAFGTRAAIGGGTVLTVAAAEALAAAGGRVMVAPNTDPAVIARAVALGMEAMPGFATATEAFAALAAGATRLKLFPGTAFGPPYLAALREVLPADAPLWAVGGAGAETLGAWLAAGAEGVGVGGSLYRAGRTPADVGTRAAALVAAWRGHRSV